MKTFEYHSPKDIKEASKIATSRSVFLAGGMTTIPSMKLGLANYKDVIDLKGIKKLSGIKVGATTRHVEVAKSKEIKKAIPSLAALADGIGDPQVRNRGTIGGSIANNDPAADYPSACIALNAVINTNNRSINAENFFKGMFETSLKSGEIIESIEFEIPKVSSYQKLANPASRYALVGVYIAKFKGDVVNVAVTGAKSCVYLEKNLSDVLSKNFSTSSIDNQKVSSTGLNSDIHASADYRANMIKVFAKKAVEAC